MAVLSRPSITGEMFGILTTLRAGQGAHLTPVSTPLALVPMRQFAGPSFGRIRPDDQSFADYSAILCKTLSDGYAGFVTG
jgi:hypothetical protein